MINMTVKAKIAYATVLCIFAHGINLPSLRYSIYVVTRQTPEVNASNL